MKGLVLFFSVSVLSACGAEDTPPASAKTEQGLTLFADEKVGAPAGNPFTCADCHATPGHESSLILPGAELAGATRRSSFWGGQESDLLRSINDCRLYFMRAAEPWSAEDEDARSLYEYLDSFGGSREAVPFTPVREIEPTCTAGDATEGERIFDGACSHCHGSIHEGKGRKSPLVPILPERVLFDHNLAAACDPSSGKAPAAAIFLSKVRHGVFFGEGGTMPPFSREVLSDTDVENLFAYLGLGSGS